MPKSKSVTPSLPTHNGYPIYTPVEDVKKTPLFKALAEQVREQDHDELARMLSFVNPNSSNTHWRGLHGARLGDAFCWSDTPQGFSYWSLLSNRVRSAWRR